jgi:hypothetical protein
MDHQWLYVIYIHMYVRYPKQLCKIETIIILILRIRKLTQSLNNLPRFDSRLLNTKAWNIQWSVQLPSAQSVQGGRSSVSCRSLHGRGMLESGPGSRVKNKGEDLPRKGELEHEQTEEWNAGHGGGSQRGAANLLPAPDPLCSHMSVWTIAVSEKSRLKSGHYRASLTNTGILLFSPSVFMILSLKSL